MYSASTVPILLRIVPDGLTTIVREIGRFRPLGAILGNSGCLAQFGPGAANRSAPTRPLERGQKGRPNRCGARSDLDTRTAGRYGPNIFGPYRLAAGRNVRAGDVKSMPRSPCATRGRRVAPLGAAQDRGGPRPATWSRARLPHCGSGGRTSELQGLGHHEVIYVSSYGGVPAGRRPRPTLNAGIRRGYVDAAWRSAVGGRRSAVGGRH